MTSQKRATGYGNAKKPDMQAAAERRWGVKMGRRSAGGVGRRLRAGPRSILIAGKKMPQHKGGKRLGPLEGLALSGRDDLKKTQRVNCRS
jgi:hypothetical protein